jgi:hypothetical protein
MKLFKISQTQNRGYDIYDSAVVAAEDGAAARLMHPSSYGGFGKDGCGYMRHDWCQDPGDVSVEYLGEAREGMPIGFVCKSFIAG